MIFLKTIRELINVARVFEVISGTHIRSLGLTPGQFDVIATLGNQPPMTCTELAARTLMVKGNLTVIIEGLLKKDIIIKESNPEDKRSSLISLTNAGNRLFHEVFPKHLQFLEPISTQFENEKTKLLQLQLAELREALEKHLPS